MCKIINWFKSLFKKEIPVKGCEKTISVEEVKKTEAIATPEEVKPVVKKKRRGRPRKKKVEQK